LQRLKEGSQAAAYTVLVAEVRDGEVFEEVKPEDGGLLLGG
jgi:hypothetical protein